MKKITKIIKKISNPALITIVVIEAVIIIGFIVAIIKYL